MSNDKNNPAFAAFVAASKAYQEASAHAEELERAHDSLLARIEQARDAMRKAKDNYNRASMALFEEVTR